MAASGLIPQATQPPEASGRAVKAMRMDPFPGSYVQAKLAFSCCSDWQLLNSLLLEKELVHVCAHDGYPTLQRKTRENKSLSDFAMGIDISTETAEFSTLNQSE